MTMTTTTQTFSGPDWVKIVDGAAPVEMLAEADWNGRYAFGTAEPDESVLGYKVTAHVAFHLPATVGGSHVWFMATGARAGLTAWPEGATVTYSVTLTPAE